MTISMKQIDVQFDETETVFEVVVEDEDGDRSAADFADADPLPETYE